MTTTPEGGGPLRLHRIRGAADPAWNGWLRVYEESFPPEERMSREWLESLFAPTNASRCLLAGLDESNQVRAISLHESFAAQGAAALWYLATQEGLRGQGLGRWLYERVRADLVSAAPLFLFYEVEMPGLRVDPEEHARRRIGWYRRLGAQQLHGVLYEQSVDTTDLRTPMYLLIHVLGQVDAEEVYERLSAILGDGLSRIPGEAVTLA